MPGRGTPKRAVRIPDELWSAARRKAKERGEDVSTVVRAALEIYVISDPPIPGDTDSDERPT